MATTYPDVVALLAAYLTPIVSPVRVAARVPDPRPAELIRVRRIGGTQLRPVRDRPRVDVVCWAATEPRATELADACRVAVHNLAGTALLGPVCYRVDEFLGPTMADDPLTGTPQVLATYTLDVRADTAIAR